MMDGTLREVFRNIVLGLRQFYSTHKVVNVPIERQRDLDDGYQAWELTAEDMDADGIILVRPMDE